MAQDDPERKKRVKPEVAGGFRDYLPGETIQRQWMIDVIRGVFELHGFMPISTPCVELRAVLSGGDSSFKKDIFDIAGRSEKPLALRFDLTVPLARFVAAHGRELQMPFRRYQVANVWRGEKPQAGRYCEFLQFDADTVGTNSMLADAEIVALIDSVLFALVGGGYTIRVNNRKILCGLPMFAGFPSDRVNDVLRVLDKLGKIGWESVVAELTRRPDNRFDEAALNLSDASVAAIRRFLDLRGLGHEEVLDEVAKLMGEIPVAAEGIQELRDVIRYVRALGVDDTTWVIDLSVARGLGYYTGPVFEASVDAAADLGSVFSGGRFDGLVSTFSPAEYGAVGASVGVDRLFTVLEKLDKLPTSNTIGQVLIVRFAPELDEEYLRIAAALRRGGVATELYMGDDSTIKGQLAYALKRGIPYVVIMGPNEAERGVVQLKDMAIRRQEEVPVSELMSPEFSSRLLTVLRERATVQPL